MPGCTLRYRPAATAGEVVRHAASLAEIQRIMESAADRHHGSEAGWLPGFSLWAAGRDTPADSLNVAIGRTGWAVVHTDDEFWQCITCGGPERGTRSVLFDDFLDLPGASFVDRDIALRVVGHWLTAGGLPDDVPFSDDLYADDPQPRRPGPGTPVT